MSGVWPGRRGQRGWWTESEEERDAKYEKGVRSSSSCFQRQVGGLGCLCLVMDPKCPSSERDSAMHFR